MHSFLIFLISFFYLIFNIPAENLSENMFSGEYTSLPAKRTLNPGGIFFQNMPYLQIWNKPVTFKIIDMNNFAGGLKPLKSSGGNMTKTLNFKGQNGKHYKFRPISKKPSLLSEYLKSFSIKVNFEDHFILYFPYATGISSFLAKKLELPSTDAILCVLPDSFKLEEFRESFSLLPGYLEHYPKQKSPQSFYNSKQILNTNELLSDKMIISEKHINLINYIKTRLLDALIGDWDRHEGQYKWLLESTSNLWTPISLDRDVAFTDFENTFMSYILKMHNNVTPKNYKIAPNIQDFIVSFTSSLPPPQRIMGTGLRHDVKILKNCKWDTFENAISLFIQALSDDILKNAVKTIPPEIFILIGEKFTSNLISRKNQIYKFAEQYFTFLNNYNPN